ncbi:MAG: hypothetical protein ABW189_07215 [Rickettsiales bacterium]
MIITPIESSVSGDVFDVPDMAFNPQTRYYGWLLDLIDPVNKTTTSFNAKDFPFLIDAKTAKILAPAFDTETTEGYPNTFIEYNLLCWVHMGMHEGNDGLAVIFDKDSFVITGNLFKSDEDKQTMYALLESRYCEVSSGLNPSRETDFRQAWRSLSQKAFNFDYPV